MLCSSKTYCTKIKISFRAPFYKIIVPTVDTVRYEFLVSKLLAQQYPVMLVGPVGTGKSSTAVSVTDVLDREKYSLLALNMSAQVRKEFTYQILDQYSNSLSLNRPLQTIFRSRLKVELRNEQRAFLSQLGARL